MKLNFTTVPLFTLSMSYHYYQSLTAFMFTRNKDIKLIFRKWNSIMILKYFESGSFR